MSRKNAATTNTTAMSRFGYATTRSGPVNIPLYERDNACFQLVTLMQISLENTHRAPRLP